MNEKITYEGFGRLYIILGLKHILFSVITPREERLLSFRLGIEDGVIHTLEETGEMMGVTRERVRQMQAKALEKMRKCIVYKAKIQT